MGRSAPNLSSRPPKNVPILRSQQSFLLIGTLAVMALGGAVVLNLPDDLPDDLPDGETARDEFETPMQAQAEPGSGGRGNGAITTMQGDPGVIPGQQTVGEPTVRDATAGVGAGAGIINGRIALDTSVLDKFHSYTIEVIEEINENARRDGGREPFRTTRRFAYDHIGTPFFTIAGIPFSRHVYLVRLHVPQLNGSQARVHITKAKPSGEVQLGLMPGVTFIVLLRDQRQTPREGLSVQMTPEGDPPGRPVYQKTSNNFGQVIFENVLQGDYKIYVGPTNAPMNVPKKITVLAINVIVRNDGHRRVSTQSTAVLVPSGAPVTVEAYDNYGYPLADTELEAHQIEVQRYFSYKGKTDQAGRHVFEHLPVGKYQLSVHKPGFGRRTHKLQIKDEDRAKLEKIQLRR